MTRLYYTEPTVLHQTQLRGMMWNPQNVALLTWTDESIIRVYHLLLDERVDYITLLIDTPIAGAAWSSDGKQIAAWGDSTITVWCLSSSCSPDFG